MKNKQIKILLAAPWFLCWVERAIEIVKKSIKNMGLLFMFDMKLFTTNMLLIDLKKKGAVLLKNLRKLKIRQDL